MSGDSNKALVRRFFDEVCNGRKPEVAPEIFASDFVYHEPASISPGGKGPDAIAQEAGNYYRAMSNAQWVIHDVLAGENDTVSVRCTSQRQDASSHSLPASA